MDFFANAALQKRPFLCGADVKRRTGLSSGTLYPALKRMKEEGFIIAKKEGIDPKIEGRPEKTLYELTPKGRKYIMDMKERLLALTSILNFENTEPEHGGMDHN